ncbi:conserved domain protein, partial [Actinomyces sp. oral taxon 170 str. F0386]
MRRTGANTLKSPSAPLMLFGVVVWGWWLQDGYVLVVWWACLSAGGGVGWCLVSWSGGSGVVGA